MDILTQSLLGATTFSLVKDKDIGKKSLLIGALAGISPDLDFVAAPFFNDIEFLSIHRSVSHSFFLAVLLTVVLSLIFHKIYDRKQNFSGWVLAFFLAIFTHPLLDWFTTYGTKLFSPLTDHLFSLNSIHVFEPLYSLILLIGFFVLLFKSSLSSHRFKIALSTLIVSSLYLGSTYVSKSHAYYHFESQFQEQNIEYSKILVSPSPLNSLLWHGIAKCDDGYYFGTYSIFDKRESIQYQFVESANEFIELIEGNRLIKMYLDYTQDFPLITADEDGNLKIYAVKYGPINYFGEPEFVYPLKMNINDLSDEAISIDYSGKQRGPVKNYKNLVRRIKGI